MGSAVRPPCCLRVNCTLMCLKFSLKNEFYCRTMGATSSVRWLGLHKHLVMAGFQVREYSTVASFPLLTPKPPSYFPVPCPAARGLCSHLASLLAQGKECKETGWHEMTLASSLLPDSSRPCSIIRISFYCQRLEAEKSGCIFSKVCISLTRSVCSWSLRNGVNKNWNHSIGSVPSVFWGARQVIQRWCSPGLRRNRTSAVTNLLQLQCWGEVATGAGEQSLTLKGSSVAPLHKRPDI